MNTRTQARMDTSMHTHTFPPEPWPKTICYAAQPLRPPPPLVRQAGLGAQSWGRNVAVMAILELGEIISSQSSKHVRNRHLQCRINGAEQAFSAEQVIAIRTGHIILDSLHSVANLP